MKKGIIMKRKMYITPQVKVVKDDCGCYLLAGSNPVNKVTIVMSDYDSMEDNESDALQLFDTPVEQIGDGSSVKVSSKGNIFGWSDDWNI